MASQLGEVSELEWGACAHMEVVLGNRHWMEW